MFWLVGRVRGEKEREREVNRVKGREREIKQQTFPTSPDENNWKKRESREREKGRKEDEMRSIKPRNKTPTKHLYFHQLY